MPIIQVTKADLMKTKTISAGIYPVEIVKVHAASTASSGKSINYPIDFEIHGANGKVITVYFNSSLIGKIAPLVEACTGKTFDPGTFDTDTLLHKKCDGKIVQNVVDGTILNNIEDFYPLGKGMEANALPFG